MSGSQRVNHKHAGLKAFLRYQVLISKTFDQKKKKKKHSFVGDIKRYADYQTVSLIADYLWYTSLWTVYIVQADTDLNGTHVINQALQGCHGIAYQFSSVQFNCSVSLTL